MSVESQVSELVATTGNLVELVTRLLNQGGAPAGESPAGGGAEVISELTTLNVGAGAEFPNIQSAWDSLRGKVLTADVIIQVADGTYQAESIVLADQPYAHRITIEGNPPAPENCILQAVAAADGNGRGVLFDNVRKLNFSGFTVLGIGGREMLWGMLVDNQAHVISDPNSIIIDGCEDGLRVTNGGIYAAPILRTVNCDQGAVISNAKAMLPDAIFTGGASRGDTAIQVMDGGYCMAEKAQTDNFRDGYLATHKGVLVVNGARADVSNEGFRATEDGCIFARVAADQTKAVAINAEEGGFIAHEHSVVYAEEAIAENIDERGFIAQRNAVMFANNTTTINCSTGYYAREQSQVWAFGTTANANNPGGVNYVESEDSFSSTQPTIYQS